MMKDFKNKKFENPLFDSEKFELNDIDIDELLDIQHNRLPTRVERCKKKGSSWEIHSISKHQLIISEIAF